MLVVSDVEEHMVSVIDAQRQNNARKLKREQVHAELAADEATNHIKAASLAAEAVVSQARQQAESTIEDARARLQQELQRQEAELRVLRVHADDASRVSAERHAAAERGLQATRDAAAVRLQQVTAANKAAIDAAKALAAETVSLALGRERESERREAEALSRAALQAAETETREARRMEEAERRVGVLEEDAQRRAELAKKAASDSIEKHSSELKEWISRAEREWEKTQERVEMDRKRAQKQAESMKALAESFVTRGTQCMQLAHEREARFKEMSEEARVAHEQWKEEELLWAIDQTDSLQGLQDLALKLRTTVLRKASS